MKELNQYARLFRADRDGFYTIEKRLGRGAQTVTYLAHRTFSDGRTESRILKEYNPEELSVRRDADGRLEVDSADSARFRSGREAFLEGARKERELREILSLQNETAPLLDVFSANNTLYLEVLPFWGCTLDQLDTIDTRKRIRVVSALFRLLYSLHKKEFLCTDLKPENIYLLFDSLGNPLCDRVHLIDFDGILPIAFCKAAKQISVSPDWAAPEELDPARFSRIGPATMAYQAAEILFVLLFGRHSKPEEHRKHSRFPYGEAVAPIARDLLRADLQKELDSFFHQTLRSDVSNRSEDLLSLAGRLDQIGFLLNQKEHLFSVLPHADGPVFGRKAELQMLSELLETSDRVILYGMAGIGKTTLLCRYLKTQRDRYEEVLYFPYEDSPTATLASDYYTSVDSLNPEPE